MRASYHLPVTHFATALLALVALAALPRTWPRDSDYEKISDLASPASIAAAMAGFYFLITAIVELRLAFTGRSPAGAWLPALLVAQIFVAAVGLLAILRGGGSLALLAHLGPVLAEVVTVSTIASISLIATWLAMRSADPADYRAASASAATSMLRMLQIAACVLLVASLVVVESRPVPNTADGAAPRAKQMEQRTSGESGGAVRP